MLNLTLFEIILFSLAAVLTAVLLAVMWWKIAGERVKALIAGWLALPLLWKIVLPMVFGAFVLHGSGKSDGVGECGSEGEIFSRVERVDRVECGGEGEVVGDSCSGRKEGENFTLHLQLKTTTSQAVERVEIEDWHRNGAWKYKDAKIEFKHGFLFPFGTNHLSSAVVVSQGRVGSSYFDSEGFVSLGAKVAMFSGESRFASEYKSSSVPGRDSYSFVWENVFVNRMRSQPMNARIELFRNGDISITTNGVVRTIPRELPFAHDGFGQAAEWVSANFTNATEILSCGYAQWVDEQVGVGLTNGLYKLTVTVPDTPLETTQLKVGDYSVAVTNAGEYVFLLEKGLEYPLSVFPETATNFVYSVTDDLAAVWNRRSGNLAEQEEYGVWSECNNEWVIVPPQEGKGIESFVDYSSSGTWSRWKYVAPARAAEDEIVFLLSGDCYSVKYKIYEPTGHVVLNVNEVNVGDSGTSGEYTLKFTYKVAPTNVSFAAVEIAEIGMVSTNVVGYFANPIFADDWDHSKCGANNWDNAGGILEDQAGYQKELLPPWGEGGSFSWPIPCCWRISEEPNVTNIYCTMSQDMSIDRNGTYTVSKFGYKGICPTNRVSQLIKE